MAGNTNPLPRDPKTGRFLASSLKSNEPWHVRARTGIRTAEFALVFAAWIGCLAAPDMLLCYIIFGAGLVVGSIAIAADPSPSRKRKGTLLLALIFFLSSGLGIAYWDHRRAQPIGVKPDAQAKATSSVVPAIPFTASDIATEVAKLTAGQQAPAEDLRVSFAVQVVQTSNVHILYTFRNEGRETAVLSGASLLEVVNHDMDANASLCDSVKSIPKHLVIGFPPPCFNDVDGDKQIISCRPVSVSVDGTPKTDNAPIEIEPGLLKKVIVGFAVDPALTAAFQGVAFCPVVFATDRNNIPSAHICPAAATAAAFLNGALQATNNHQYRILPYTAGPACPDVTGSTDPPAAPPPSPSPPASPPER